MLEYIKNCTNPTHYSFIFGDSSIFHYFAGETKVIEIIYDKFYSAKNEVLDRDQKNIPLILLFPDNNGDTALEKAQ